MAKQPITKKSQIPKYAQKKIKNFKKLTTNQALYEYEMVKLERRAGGDFKYFLRGYFERPERVTKKAIQEIAKFRGKKLEKERSRYDTENRLRRIELQERESYQVESPQITTPEISKPTVYEPDEDFPDFTDDVYTNEERQREADETPTYDDSDFSDYEDFSWYEEPEPSIDDYWIDPNTGEAIPWEDIRYADAERAAIDFLNDLKDFLRQEADAAAISHSYYTNGRTKSASQRRFYDNNINSALEKIIDKIDSILNTPNKLSHFVDSHRGATNNWEALVLAASEYIHDSYKTKGGDPVQAARLNALLDAGPISLDESLDFIDSAYDIDE